MTDKTIKRFVLEGVSKDSGGIASRRDFLENQLMLDMQDKGYIPVLDLAPVLRIEYDAEREQFAWTLTIQGVHVGRKRAEELTGISGNLEVKRRTPPTK